MMQEAHDSSADLINVIQAQVVTGSAEPSMDYGAPGWWFQNFNPIWGPFVQWLHRQKHMTLPEFRLITAHVPGLTAVEKSIVVSAFIAYKNLQY